MTKDKQQPEPWRGLRMYSSSALAELTGPQLEDWAGASRQAIDQFQSLLVENERLREGLREIVEAQDATNAEAEGAKQPGANAWSSAPMVRLIQAHEDARTLLEDS